MWTRVSHNNPCPVCKGTTWCAITPSGTKVKCCRVSSSGKVASKTGEVAWMHELNQPVKAERCEKPKRSDTRKVRQLAKQWYTEGSEGRRKLSGLLGVAESSLDSIRAGYGEGVYSFPEWNDQGRIVGLALRTASGRKWFLEGSKRGIICPQGQSLPGPLLIVEGASDVAACLSAGWEALGRPSCTGGSGYIAGTVLKHYFDREVVVVGENDKKSKDSREDWPCGYCGECLLCWPGWYGAVFTANALSTALNRNIAIWIPPDGIKDCRDMLNKTGKIDPDEFHLRAVSR